MIDDNLLEEIIRAIGEEATLALLEHFGGTRLYVAYAFRAKGKMLKAISPETAAALSAHFAPASI